MSETINELYLKYIESVSSLEDDRYFRYLFEIIQAGDNVLQQNRQVLHKVVDEAWLTMIEDTLDALNTITEKPRRFVSTTEEVVPVSLAKKITAQSVRHLSMNTQFIASSENGDVQPTRVLNITQEDSYDLYENRFIYHLIQKLVVFIDKRTDVIFWSTGDEIRNTMTLESKIDDAYEEIEYKIEMKVKNRQSFAENDADNMDIFMRIDRVRRMTMALRNSAFCELMAGCAKVRSPIQRTNLLMKDPNYCKCYQLWQFLENYEGVGYTIEEHNAALEFDEEYLIQMYINLIANYAVFKSLSEEVEDRNLEELEKAFHQVLKPKFVKEIHEEIVDDYNIPEVEVRQVIIEEVTQAQLDAEARLAEEIVLREQAEAARDEAESGMQQAMIQSQQCMQQMLDAQEQAELAQSMQSAAENAAELANTAREEAESAKAEAERRAEEACDARDAAQKALLEAQQQKTEAEEARDSSEAAKATAEEKCAAAIAEKLAAENICKAAEEEKNKALSCARDAERAKLEAETARSKAETYAAEAEKARFDAEKARDAALSEKESAIAAEKAAKTAVSSAVAALSEAQAKADEAVLARIEAERRQAEAEKTMEEALAARSESLKAQLDAEAQAFADREAKALAEHECAAAIRAKQEADDAAGKANKAAADANEKAAADRAERESVEEKLKEALAALEEADRARKAAENAQRDAENRAEAHRAAREAAEAVMKDAELARKAAEYASAEAVKREKNLLDDLARCEKKLEKAKKKLESATSKHWFFGGKK